MYKTMKLCDAFITSVPLVDGIPRHRQYFYELTKQALIDCGVVPLIVRAPSILRFAACENSAKTEVYVISDDDCIPMHPDALINAMEVMVKLPEVGLLGLAPKRGIMKRDIKENFKSDLGRGIYEVDKVSGIRLIRKGIVPLDPKEWDKLKTSEWKVFQGHGLKDDKLLCEMVMSKGFKVALDTNNYYHHLGEGYSNFTEDNVESYVARQ